MIPTAGVVDADALLASEKPSPAAPSTFMVADLVVRFCFVEACLTRGMVPSPYLRECLRSARLLRRGRTSRNSSQTH